MNNERSCEWGRGREGGRKEGGGRGREGGREGGRVECEGEREGKVGKGKSSFL